MGGKGKKQDWAEEEAELQCRPDKPTSGISGVCMIHQSLPYWPGMAGPLYPPCGQLLAMGRAGTGRWSS